MNSKLERLNALSAADAIQEFLGCCGSTRWASEMAGARPFAGVKDVFDSAEKAFSRITDEDWLEAFRSHPKIGNRKAAVDTGVTAERWSQQEQSGAREATTDVLAEMAAANLEYEQKFGYIFIVFATGKTVEQMLSLLQSRMGNAPATELHIAAQEQRRITRLRLERLLET